MAPQRGETQQRETNRSLTSPEPGTPSDHFCDAVNTDHRNGETHRSPTSMSKEGRQDCDASRQVQVHAKPSYEYQVGGSNHESPEDKQSCA